MRKIVFDIETANLFSDVGSSDPRDLDISVVCIYDSGTDTFSSYFVDELPKLWPILESADLLIGFNSDHFDTPLLDKYYPGDLTKIPSLDILKEVKNQYGRRMKLDQIAEGTLKTNKISDGLEALRWWREGLRDKVVEYCIADVRITRDIYEYARKHNKLKFAEGGKVISFPIDASGWESGGGATITHTLPF
jgi:DEAD/DEAH box helicase domain-containing protein